MCQARSWRQSIDGIAAPAGSKSSAVVTDHDIARQILNAAPSAAGVHLPRSSPVIANAVGHRVARLHRSFGISRSPTPSPGDHGWLHGVIGIPGKPHVSNGSPGMAPGRKWKRAGFRDPRSKGRPSRPAFAPRTAETERTFAGARTSGANDKKRAMASRSTPSATNRSSTSTRRPQDRRRRVVSREREEIGTTLAVPRSDRARTAREHPSHRLLRLRSHRAKLHGRRRTSPKDD